MIECSGLSHLRNRSLNFLSSDEKPKTASASVPVLNPKICIFDESTTNLDEAATFILADTLKVLKNNGNTLIVAEHRLSYLNDIADRYIYLENRQITAEFTVEEMKKPSEKERLCLGLQNVSNYHT